MLYRLKDDFIRIAHLLHASTPNLPILMAILNQQCDGQIWVDNPSAPNAYLAISSSPYCFIGGKPSFSVIDMMFKILKGKRQYSLIAPSATYLNINLKAHDLTCHDRIQFRLKNTQDEVLDSWISKLPPEEFTLTTFDKELIEKCISKKIIPDLYKNTELLVENAYGACIVHKERVVSEAFVGFIGENEVEIIAATRESYWGQNLATIATAFLIKNIQAKGKQSICSFDHNNKSAIKVAMKLGFEEDCKYCFFVHK